LASTHVVDSSVAAYFPGSHSSHELASAALNVPALQIWDSVAPTSETKDPAFASVHDADPDVDVKRPGSHGSWAVAAFPSTNEPGSAGEQLFEPASWANFPGSQSRQEVAPAALIVPALQRFCESAPDFAT